MYTLFIDKPEAKSQSQSNPEKIKWEFGLWAVTKISWATTPPITFKHEEASNEKTQRVNGKSDSV